METMKIRKWFFVWDYDKMEAWLNGMAMEGWALDEVGICEFRFVRSEPGEYGVRVQMGVCDENYERLLKEDGVEKVGFLGPWGFYRKKTEDGPFELYSDIDSRIDHINKIARVLTVIGALNIFIGLVNVRNGFSWVNLLCATFLMYCLGRIHGKREALEKERLLHE